MLGSHALARCRSPRTIAGSTASLVLAATFFLSTATGASGGLEHLGSAPALREATAAGTALCGSATSQSCDIDVFGGRDDPLVPGGPGHVTTVRLSGGAVRSGLTLLPRRCAAVTRGSGDLCRRFRLTLFCTAVAPRRVGPVEVVYDDLSLASLRPASISGPSACGSSIPSPSFVRFSFFLRLSSSTGDRRQGQVVSQPFTWSAARA